MEAARVKCAVIDCEMAGVHRVRQLPGRLYCLDHFKLAAHKCMVLDRALRAIERRNEGARNGIG
jgi:hypothetical protein